MGVGGGGRRAERQRRLEGGVGTVIKPFPAGLSFISSSGRVIFLLETIWGEKEERSSVRIGKKEKCSSGTAHSTPLRARLNLPLCDPHYGRQTAAIANPNGQWRRRQDSCLKSHSWDRIPAV